MNKQKKTEQKRLKRKKIVEQKKAVKRDNKIRVAQRIKVIKSELQERMKNAIVITPEKKAEYVKEAKRILGIPEDREVTFEQIVHAVQLAKKRFESQGVDIAEVIDNRVKENEEKGK